MLSVVDRGQQVALMAPTEVLAEQHAVFFKSLLDDMQTRCQRASRTKVKKESGERKKKKKERKRVKETPRTTIGDECAAVDCLSPLPLIFFGRFAFHFLRSPFALRSVCCTGCPAQIALLSGSTPKKARDQVYDACGSGVVSIIVGTHSLINENLSFKDLGLAVIDEQHKFGVLQRAKLRSDDQQPHYLVLSATPIPRTLYMALSGVREMSLITTPPPSRRAIKTHLSPYDPEAIRSAARQELDRGGQIFYVVPRVEGIEEVSARLREWIPGARIMIAHGQMQEGELESTMLGFSSGEADILVCTTIIESGLDIPRVNTILIEDAQKFGLSQLYQLRGRVGRSGIQAHAWLFYPRQQTLSPKARQRLRAIQEFAQLGSGYQLAMRDMEIRGVGNLLGVQQSGQMDAVGFDLYMDMLEEEIAEIRGQEIPKVDDTQVDLKVTAFIPNDYIDDTEQKMTAYRALAAADSKRELAQVAADLNDRYGTIPFATAQLIRILELKQLGKQLGFARIKPEGKQHILLETPMEEPAWKLLFDKIPGHLKSRFVYANNKVTVRGLGVLKPEKQLDNLLEWFQLMRAGLPEKEGGGAIA